MTYIYYVLQINPYSIQNSITQSVLVCKEYQVTDEVCTFQYSNMDQALKSSLWNSFYLFVRSSLPVFQTRLVYFVKQIFCSGQYHFYIIWVIWQTWKSFSRATDIIQLLWPADSY